MDAFAFWSRPAVKEEKVEGETSECSEELLAGPTKAKAAASFDVFSVMRMLFVSADAQPAPEEVAPWQFERAADTVSAFCNLYPATRVRPNSEELLVLWQKCTSLHETAMADAFVGQLFGEGGECEWQPRLRALHAMAFFVSHGGVGCRAALAAAEDAKDLLDYLVAEVPRCSPEAAAMLRRLRGEPGEELPRLGLVRRAVEPVKQPAADTSPPAACALEPRPRSIAKQAASRAVVVDKEPEVAFGAFQIAGPCAKQALPAELQVVVPDLVLQPMRQCTSSPTDWAELGRPEAAPLEACFDSGGKGLEEDQDGSEGNGSEEDEDGAQVEPGEALPSTADPCEQSRSDLGYHWLERSAVEALSFAKMEEAFQRLDSDIEQLKRRSSPTPEECMAR